MNYRDTWTWPSIPVDEVDREAIETIYSFGHNDGPAVGLICWQGQHWWVSRFGEPLEDRFWIIRLSSEEQAEALRYGSEWARLFHSGMTWNPDGSPVPEQIGIYAHRWPSPGCVQIRPEGREVFRQAFPRRPDPRPEAEVVGWFRGWRRADG